jgi:hypothetical protein
VGPDVPSGRVPQHPVRVIPAGESLSAFRGATAERRTGVSWTASISRADQFRQRHSWHAPTAIYQTVVTPDAVLELLERRGEGQEIVVDPELLTVIDQVGPYHAHHFLGGG